jgi:phosphate transport system permease protein
LILAISIGGMLLTRSAPILTGWSFSSLFLSPEWDPLDGRFGLLGPILGTVHVTAIALGVAVPVSILSSILIAEYTPPRMARAARAAIDVLAGVPSVVYGLCAILVLVPLVRDTVGPAIGVRTQGFCVLTAGITLSVMVFPIIISLSIESLSSVPSGLREASLSVGATRWQTVKGPVIRRAMPGIASAVLLGFGRAIGETMAVAMLIGNRTGIPGGLFGPASTLPSLIVANYGEMMSIPRYEGALMLSALVLLVVTMATTLSARALVRRASARWGG